MTMITLQADDDEDQVSRQVPAVQTGENWFIPQHDACSHWGGETFVIFFLQNIKALDVKNDDDGSDNFLLLKKVSLLNGSCPNLERVTYL